MKLKLLTLALLPLFAFAQKQLDTITMLSGKVKLLAPADLKPMSDKMWVAKYRNATKPALVLSDEPAEVNLIGSETGASARENQMEAYKNVQLEGLKKARPDVTMLSNGVKTVNGKQVGYFKFISQAIDQKVFNYYFFIISEGKVLLFSFNCIEKLQKDWEPTAEKIVASLRTK